MPLTAAKTGVGIAHYTLGASPSVDVECGWLQSPEADAPADPDMIVACLAPLPLPISMLSDFSEVNSLRYEGDSGGCQFHDGGIFGDGYWEHGSGVWYVTWRSYDITGQLGLSQFVDLHGETNIPFVLELPIANMVTYQSFDNSDGEACNQSFEGQQFAGWGTGTLQKNRWGIVGSLDATASLSVSLSNGFVLATIEAAGVGSGEGDQVSCEFTFFGLGQAQVTLPGGATARTGTLSSNGECASTPTSIVDETNEFLQFV